MNWIKNIIKKIKMEIRYRKRLRELRKRDPPSQNDTVNPHTSLNTLRVCSLSQLILPFLLVLVNPHACTGRDWCKKSIQYY